MAIKGEVIFYDSSGSEMEGPRTNKSSIIYEFNQECAVPHQAGGYAATGSRIYQPFTIVKTIDKLTPLLWKALANNEFLKKVEVTLYEIAEKTGTETPYFKFTLTEARISSMKNYMPTSLVGSENETVGHLEEVSLVARTYNWVHLTASTEHEDTGFFEAAQEFMRA